MALCYITDMLYNIFGYNMLVRRPFSSYITMLYNILYSKVVYNMLYNMSI